jgi:hypothetical protein
MKDMRIGRGGTGTLRRALLLALAAAASLALGAEAQQASAPAADALPPPEACTVPPRLLPQGAALHHTRSSWMRGEPLVVVAIGSGSTVGSADGKFAAYPHFLSAALTAKLPGREVRIVAQGRQGDTAETMVGHFRSNVLPEKPSLVIWQTGTVEAARGLDADSFAATLDEGITLLTANKMDVLLVNPQYASRIELLINYDPYLSAMENAAFQTDATLFDRFHIMHRWVTRGVFNLNSGNREQRRRKAEQAQACIGMLLSDVIMKSLQ